MRTLKLHRPEEIVSLTYIHRRSNGHSYSWFILPMTPFYPSWTIQYYLYCRLRSTVRIDGNAVAMILEISKCPTSHLPIYPWFFRESPRLNTKTASTGAVHCLPMSCIENCRKKKVPSILSYSTALEPYVVSLYSYSTVGIEGNAFAMILEVLKFYCLPLAYCNYPWWCSS
jgi:hypothetical protein